MGVWRPRPLRALGLWRAGETALKAYAIEAAPLEDAQIAAARAETLARLPDAARAEGEASGLGFAVLHKGEAGLWLLANWWAHEDICCGLLLRAEPEGADFQPVGDRPLLACVWELAVIEHERQAWIRRMMVEVPDAEAYLADVLQAETV